MKIFISHSSGYDYEGKLYTPLEKSSLVKNHEIVLPHKGKVINTKEVIANSDLVIAEVSMPTTGQGIELGWADYSGTPILCIYEKGARISSALKFITQHFIEYVDAGDMVSKIADFLEGFHGV